jgi:putative two-component system response regulator
MSNDRIESATSMGPLDVTRASILIVDDEPTNVRLLESMLRMEGYTNLTSTQDSRSVVELYKAQRFDIILLDINMPYMDGFQVMAQLRALHLESYIPILVLTAQADTATRLQALEAGAKDFVSKPFIRQEVMTRIRNILEVRLAHNYLQNQNQLLDRKVRERTREIEETRLEIIRRLGRAAEYRDNETGLHIIRMSKYSEMLGRAAGMSSAESSILLDASPMHDIGKIGIPDSILLKPGKLDPGEWEVMKTHTTIGAEILSGHDSDLLETARLIAVTHHEKWDGSGYPNGLKGAGIPLVGRIVAVCDVFDALVSWRPYKQAWPVEDAIAEIRSQAGRHFDPELVGLFMKMLPDVLEVRHQYAEPGEAA